MEDHRPRSARAERREREAASSVVGRAPSIELAPRAPAVPHLAALVEAPAYPTEACVLLGRIVDLEDDDLGAAIAVEVGDSDARPLVEP